MFQEISLEDVAAPFREAWLEKDAVCFQYLHNCETIASVARSLGLRSGALESFRPIIKIKHSFVIEFSGLFL